MAEISEYDGELVPAEAGELLTDRLSHTLAVAERSGHMVALLYLDLDGFKLVNDSLGHHVGDRLLVKVATRLRSRVRQSDTVIEVLNRTGLPPALLQIELTESVMLRAVDRAAEAMHALRGLGVTFAIDDFGTGYSCLSYLPKLPIEALKIDRSFLTGLDSRSAAKGMVHSLIALAHNLDMRVIVEGVEHPEQITMIRAMGGNEVQGFLLGRPLADPATQISQLVTKDDELCAAAGDRKLW